MTVNFFDANLLACFNELVAYSQWTFYQALFLSNHPAWWVAACGLIALWFSGRTRLEDGRFCGNKRNRQLIFLLFAALVLSFVSARLLSIVFERSRPLLDAPLVIPIDPTIWAEIRNSLVMQGAFPSDHAAMFAVMTAGVFLISRGWGWLALALNLFFAVLRVGIGFHWPTDMLAGELIGVLMVLLLIKLQPFYREPLDWFYCKFEQYSPVTYPLTFLMLIDFTQKFHLLFTVLALVKRKVLPG